MPLTIHTKADILRRMQGRVVTRSNLTDLSEVGSVNQTLEAAASEDARQWFGIYKARRLMDLRKVTGDDLDEWAVSCNPDLLSRDPPTYGTGQVRFSRTGTTGDVTIPVGQEVKIPATGAQEERVYVTTSVGTILNGNTESDLVDFRSSGTGTTYNCDPDTIVSFGTAPVGVDAVTNPAAVTNANDRESDDHFRQRITLFRKSLARGTHSALTYAALTARDETTGKRVLYVSVIEDEWDPGHVTAYIDDGSGTAEETDDVTDETQLTAVGGEHEFYLLHAPVKTEAGFALEVNASPLTEGTDYTLNPANGHVKLTQTSYPNGLTVGDVVTATFTYWTGLVAEAQRIIDRDPDDLVNYPGYRAAGILVRVLVPQILYQSVSANITVQQGFSQSSVAESVVAAISRYINSLGVGEDLIFAELVEQCMVVPGMYNINFSAPTEDKVVLDTQLARVLSSAITVG
jgi:uncharacterized phage protein gp47/JayE